MGILILKAGLIQQNTLKIMRFADSKFIRTSNDDDLSLLVYSDINKLSFHNSSCFIIKAKEENDQNEDNELVEYKSFNYTNPHLKALTYSYWTEEDERYNLFYA